MTGFFLHDLHYLDTFTINQLHVNRTIIAEEFCYCCATVLQPSSVNRAFDSADLWMVTELLTIPFNVLPQ